MSSDKTSLGQNAALASTPKPVKITPFIAQFQKAKLAYPNGFLFFRMGDFYELFFEDAVKASQLLGITLTSRNKNSEGEDIPMAGVPHHAAQGYIKRLIEDGHSVSICEQMADPKSVKGIVPREVIRVATPSMVLDDETANPKTDNNLISAVWDTDNHAWALAVLSLGRASIFTTHCSKSELEDALLRHQCKELVMASPAATKELPAFSQHVKTLHPPFPLGLSKYKLISETHPTPVFSPFVKEAIALACMYAQSCYPLRPLSLKVEDNTEVSRLKLNAYTIKHLELIQSHTQETKHTLLHHIDHTRSALGARELRKRLLNPFAAASEITPRHDAVALLLKHRALRKQLQDALSNISDLERIASRVAMKMGVHKDLVHLKETLDAMFDIHAHLEAANLSKQFKPLQWTDTQGEIKQILVPISSDPDSPIQAGFDPELDQCIKRKNSIEDAILALETSTKVSTKITSLKIKYTKVFGYYFEVTKTNLPLVPTSWKRKQTIAGGERFITPELQQLESEMQTFQLELEQRQQVWLSNILSRIAEYHQTLLTMAQQLAILDVDLSFAQMAEEQRHVRPAMTTSEVLHLKACRHPVVERMLPHGAFVPNDVDLSSDATKAILLTGPNMSGKSTMMRQVAINVLLAQCGGFVAAQEARIGLVDQIFSRVGSSDSVATGESTFMMEMKECAAILDKATSRSLVIVDEVGRGTSTYDGLSLAWAILLHLLQVNRCRLIFSTHYHELCHLEAKQPTLKNFTIMVKEDQHNIQFLHQVIPGAAKRSYGIAVAKLAQLPSSVIADATQILEKLEHDPQPVKAPVVSQPSSPHPLLESLANLDLNHTSPMQALEWLQQKQSELRLSKTR